MRTGASRQRGFEVAGPHVHGIMLAIARESDNPGAQRYESGANSTTESPTEGERDGLE